MADDHKALEEKKRAIVALAENALSQYGSSSLQLANFTVEAFTRITPPTSEKESHMELIVFRANSRGTRRGSTRKPGNIYLNWQKLMDVVPDVTLASAGAATAPAWLLPFIGLYVWNKLWSGAKEEFSEAEAVIMYSLWNNKDNQNKISDDQGYEVTNKFLSEMDTPALSRSEYDHSISRLLRMECIELNEGVIWLREWVRVSYV